MFKCKFEYCNYNYISNTFLYETDKRYITYDRESWYRSIK